MSIHSATAQDGFLRRTFFFLLVAAVLLATAHRLPAPIQEVPESPTPAPEKSAKPKAKQTAGSKPSIAEPKASVPSKRVTPVPTPSKKFPGTWRGTVPFGMFGDLHLTLVVNNDGNAVTESGGLGGTVTFRATNDGDTVTWRSGLGNEIHWTLTPNTDGKTAILDVKAGLFVGNHTAIFQRTSP